VNTEIKTDSLKECTSRRVFFNESERITEVELQMMALDGKLNKIVIHDTDKGFYVTVKMLDKQERFVGTRRERVAPRIFKDYHRLMRLLHGFSIDREKIEMIYE